MKESKKSELKSIAMSSQMVFRHHHYLFERKFSFEAYGSDINTIQKQQCKEMFIIFLTFFIFFIFQIPTIIIAFIFHTRHPIPTTEIMKLRIPFNVSHVEHSDCELYFVECDKTHAKIRL